MTGIKLLKLSALAGLAAISVTTASAGEWVLNPAKCPDLIEDRLDRQVTTGPADLRGDIRDMHRVECPASAWTYRPTYRERPATRVRLYTGPRAVFVGRRGYDNFPPVAKGKTRKARSIHIHIG